MNKKAYKKGMTDAMEAYQDFGKKQEKAIRHVGKEIEKTSQKVDKLGGKIGEIADYITDKEKAELYKLNTPVDIADLDDAEKRILVAVLYQLSADEDEITEEQQNYVRSVQQYLKIYNPQTEIDLEAVENIEDISAQKAVLQAALEFFRLGTHPEELTEEQEDFLDCFQVNRKTFREINSYIDAIVEAVGLRGLSEKYGFVAAQPRSGFAKYKDNGPIPEKTAEICFGLLAKKGGNRFKRFHNGLYFLETNDYLLCCAEPEFKHNSIPSKNWEGNAPKERGFFCIEKQTGKIKHIDIDYKKDFPFVYVGELRFAIHNNIVYFIENSYSSNSSRSNAHILMIDLKHNIYLLLPFAASADNYTKFHLSANETYLLAHSYQLKDEDQKSMSSKTYVVDLTQEFRTFTLDCPGLVVKDAFIFENEFIVTGCKGIREPLALYRYDIANKSVHQIFQLTDFSSLDRLSRLRLSRFLRGTFYESAFAITPNGRPAYCSQQQFFDSVWHIDNSYYFHICVEDAASFGKVRWSLFRFHRENADDKTYIVQEIFMAGDTQDVTWLVHRDRYALFFTDNTLQKYDFETGEKNPITWCELCDTLGDYLFIKDGDEFKKANISNGFDNLQWEIVQYQD